MTILVSSDRVQESPSASSGPEELSTVLNDFNAALQSGDEEKAWFLLPTLLATIRENVALLQDDVFKNFEFLDKKKIEDFTKQAEAQLEQIRSEKKGKAWGIISGIFSGLSVVAAAVFFIAAPSPLSATVLIMSLGLLIDTVVANATDNPTVLSKVIEQFSKITEKFDFLPPAVRSAVASVLAVAAIAVVVFLISRGGAAALNSAKWFPTWAPITNQTALTVTNYTNATSAVAQNASTQAGAYFTAKSAEFQAEGDIVTADIELDITKEQFLYDMLHHLTEVTEFIDSA